MELFNVFYDYFIFLKKRIKVSDFLIKKSFIENLSKYSRLIFIQIIIFKINIQAKNKMIYFELNA